MISVNRTTDFRKLSRDIAINKNTLVADFIKGFSTSEDTGMPYIELRGMFRIYITKQGFVGRQNGYIYQNCSLNCNIEKVAKYTDSDSFRLFIKLGILSSIQHIDEYAERMGLDVEKMKPGKSLIFGETVNASFPFARISDKDIDMIDKFASFVAEKFEGLRGGFISLDKYKLKLDNKEFSVEIPECIDEFIKESIAIEALSTLMLGMELKTAKLYNAPVSELKSLQDLEPRGFK